MEQNMMWKNFPAVAESHVAEMHKVSVLVPKILQIQQQPLHVAVAAQKVPQAVLEPKDQVVAPS